MVALALAQDEQEVCDRVTLQVLAPPHRARASGAQRTLDRRRFALGARERLPATVGLHARRDGQLTMIVPVMNGWIRHSK